MTLDTQATFRDVAHKFTQFIEPVVLAGMLLAFWYRSPPRDQWTWLLAAIPIIWGLRWLTVRRFWTRTPLDPALLALVGLGILNVYFAPYRRSADMVYSFFTLMGRPLLGIALILYFVEYARQRQRLNGLVGATLLLGLIVTILGLGASQWTTKSDQVRFLIDPLPFIGDYLKPFDAGGGFNVNEIGGALAWVCPLMAGVMAYYRGRGNRVFQVLATVIFLCSFLALFLGQSRFALAGVLVALTMIVWLVVRNRRGRWLAWGALVAIAVLEVMIVRNVFQVAGATQLAGRDEDSVSVRFDVWNSALDIIKDRPLTGVGLNMFRDGRVRQLYPVPTFQHPVLPHTHQEWLQIGTDMGLPGLAVYIALQVVVAWMLYRAFREGDNGAKAIVAGVGGGLLAHGIFGLGDAIPIWDRFAFVSWWLIGLGSAQYFLTLQTKGVSGKASNISIVGKRFM